ncbi:unnamed protein product [Mytilus coruscus]|uniref:BACK domain-containing protein n=1 Tax=Mytilus coruscus TaxID=42192 RepID=A0A6J8CQK7_MYTCO|nr:unnamed protein product [Mytilus coruscus]
MESIDTNVVSSYDAEFKETKNNCDVQTLVIQCQNFIASSITISKAISLISFVKQFNLDRLSDAVLECISENFKIAVENGLFNKLSHEDFKFLLNNEKLTVFSHGIPVENFEACILASLGNYLSANNVEHEESVEDLLSVIRLSDIPLDMLETVTNGYTVFHAFKARMCSEQRTKTLISRKYSQSESHLNSFQEYASIPTRYLEKYKFDIVSSFNDSESIEINDRPITIGVWIVTWEGCVIVGGLYIHYQSGKYLVHGTKPARHNIVNEQEFTLQEDEVVTSIKIWHGMFIDSITFFTNMGHTFGPYGGNGGHRSDLDIPPSNHGYFHSFKGKVVKHRYANSVAYLQFNWVAFGKDGYREILPTGSVFSSTTSGLEEFDRMLNIN